MNAMELVNRHFGKNFDLSIYKKIGFFGKRPENDWQKFLVKRVRAFKILHLLSGRLDSEFFVGYNLTFSYNYCEEDPNPPEDIAVGSCIVDVKLTGKQLFDFFLSKLAIAQIDVAPDFDPYAGPFVGKKGDIAIPENFSPVLDSVFFVSDDLIINEDSFYVKKPMHLWDEKLFKDFFEEFRSLIVVSHDLYVDWLLKWFPGLIKIRSLGYSPVQ